MALTTGTIDTKIPRRLDRLPWSRWHWFIVISLGTVWILDGLEVTIKGAVGAQISESLGFSTVSVAALASIYLFGAISGALVWGYLTDRFGRRKLFMITLSVYMVGVIGTALAGLWGLGFAYIWFGVARFLTGFGIGGEYAAVNSTIDELMPARVRGWVALGINGSWWFGAMIAAALGYLFLLVFPSDVGWRVAFGMGLLIAVGVLLLRFYVPESPRWLITHAQPDEADRVMDRIEANVDEETEEPLPEPYDEPLQLRMRRSTGFIQIAKTTFGVYPKRSIVAYTLMVGQAFLYNAIFFTYGLMLTTYYGISPTTVGLFLIPFAASNFLGAIVLGRFFDTLGRRLMIPLTFIVAGVCTVITGYLFAIGLLGALALTLAWVVIFFFATAGASAAYLTMSETFPMEIRAMVIGFFYAAGTATGGITGPLLYGALITPGNRWSMFIGYVIGAGIMIAAGLIHRFLGVEAGQQSLEDVAAPLSLEEAREQARQRERGEQPPTEPTTETRPEQAEERPEPAEEEVQVRAPAPRPYRQRTMTSNLPLSIQIPREDWDIDAEIEKLVRALDQDGPAARRELSRRVRSRYWGPGRFRQALRVALAEQRIERRGSDGRRYAVTQQEHDRVVRQDRGERQAEQESQ